jgi:Protein of unknown function (DUF3108)
MQRFLWRQAGAGVLLAATLTCALAEDEHPSARRAFDLPPSAELTYDLAARQSGFSLSGKARVTWDWGEGKYLVNAESRVAILGKITENRSQGLIDSFGLAPAEFYEKRFRKEPTTSNFDRASKTLGFSDGKQTYPLKGGEQDRASVTWQLVAQARAAGEHLRPGTQWAYFVAGRRDADPWVFKVMKHEKVSTAMGDFDTVHIMRVETEAVKGQNLDIWLAPAQDWYPVKLRFADDDKDVVEQTIEKIVKK